MPSVIEVESLCKEFRVPVRGAGLLAGLQSLIKRDFRTVEAVRDVSFQVDEGEIVGFLGPNGAGKTTTLKMLTGLIHPSDGSARVMGFTPWEREKAYLSRINMVMGNRHQLSWDLPAADSYEMLRTIYRIPPAEFQRTLDELVDLLDLEGLLDKPMRQLSLGERMKCELAGALLHSPRVMFLDEPTLGLDVTMQHRIRNFIREYNQRNGSSILLTSHYMADIEALCRRVVVIHEGRILFDGLLSELVSKFATTKLITFELDTMDADLGDLGIPVVREGLKYQVEVDKERTLEITNLVLDRHDVSDISIEDPAVEHVIDRVFTGQEL